MSRCDSGETASAVWLVRIDGALEVVNAVTDLIQL